MITVDLIHPIRKEAVQSWTFDESQRVVRIGRSRKNDISLLSGVVSREHAALKFDGKRWTLHSLGANGCYLDDRPVKSITLDDGAIFRIARTGPRLRIRVDVSQVIDFRATQPGSSQVQKPASRSRLSQEEITTARETWIAPTGSTFSSLQRQSLQQQQQKQQQQQQQRQQRKHIPSR